MKRTIQDVIDLIIASVPGAPQEDSVDVFKCGDPSQEVTGIVTTFKATFDVLRKAVALGANLVITHEPTFYEHREETAWLGDDLLGLYAPGCTLGVKVPGCAFGS